MLPLRLAPPRKVVLRITMPCIVCATAVLLTGCSGLPAVKAWEKGNLTKAEMVFDADNLDARLSEHIYFSKEAASGGTTVGGGGCGCN